MTIPDTSERHVASGRRTLPPFFWVALALGVAFFALLAWQTPRAFRDGVWVRDDGWTARAADGGWIVATVNPAGQAASVLAPGDRLVAIDGDTRAGHVGPSWQLAPLTPGLAYRVTVRRAGADVTAALQVGARPDPQFAVMILIYLAVALASLSVAMMIVVARPEERMVQLLFFGQLMTGAFMLWFALRPGVGIRQDGMVHGLGMVFPIYFVMGYLFFERFPRPFPTTRRWTFITRSVVIGSAPVWLLHNVLALVWALPVERRLDVLDRAYGSVRLIQAIGPTTDMIFVVGAFAAMFGVLRRNYRLLPEGGDRRRLRIVALGQGLSFIPAFAAAAASAVANLMGAGAAVLQAVELSKKAANALTIATPLSFGYVIIKHRVLGFRVFVRLGIQYLLAQNALRTAVLLPLGWLVYTAVMHPDRTVAEILLAGYAKLNLAVIVVAGVALQYRTQVSDAIDRRFFRSAYDQEAILRRLIDSVKAADSIAEIAGMASREIDAALHVTRVFVFYHDTRKGAFSVGYSTQAETPLLGPLSEESPLLRELGRTGAVRLSDELRTRATPQEAAWLSQLEVELVAPLTGIDQNVVGLLMVGAKRSEEPYTSKDKGLLRLVASQIGQVYEVLMLRERVGRQEEIQSEVLAGIDERRINLVKECPTCGRCYDRKDESCEDDGSELVFSLPVERTIDGKYRLDRLLGKGGMGAVYVAQDRRLNRRVAIKVIKGSSFHSQSARRRFAREAQACARLTHPHIIRVYDYGAFEQQSAYLVMELVEGRSWRAELNRLGTFVPGAAAALLDQVCDGMQAAHAAGVLHRDLKPDNLMIYGGAHDGQPQVKILDFGLAKVREATFTDPKSVTVAGVAMGTFGYMSPEQLAAGPVDERTDVYSLGVVALETLTGTLPAYGPTFHAALEAEADRRLMAAATTQPQLALAQAVRRAMALDRAQRFASVRELREVLIPAIRGCVELPIKTAGGSPIGTDLPRTKPGAATTHLSPEDTTRSGSDRTESRRDD